MCEEVKVKRCSKCGRELPANSDYFFKRKESKDGLMGVCKECKGKSFTNKLNYQTEEGRRICYKCKEKYELNDDNFYRSSLNKEGFRTTCKNCDNEVNKIYKSNNKELTKKQWKNWYAKNKEYISKYNREYRDKNIKRIKKYNKEYQKQYRKTAKGKTIRKKHYHIREAKIKNLKYDFTEQDWLDCQNYFNFKCAYCGRDNEKLTQDHFIPLNNGGTYTKNNIIPCCFSCNSSKQDKDFYEWYKTKEFYDVDRIIKVEEYINKNINNIV